MSLWKKRAVALSTVARAPSSLAPASASAMAPAGADPSSSGTSGAFAALAAAVAATALGVAVSTNTAHADSAQSSGTRVWVKRTPGAVPTRAGTASEDEEQDEEEEEVQAIEVAHSREESATQEPQGTNKKLNRTGSAAFADGPFFTRAEVEAHYEWDPKSAAADPEKRVWVTYNRGVYDITDFLKNHPGGHERIMGAAGGDVAPFWQQYQQHYAPHVYAQLAELRIGTLAPGEEVVKLNASDDPYVAEPKRVEALAAAALKVKPYNAESPTLTLDSVGAAAAAAATLEAGKAEGDVPRVSFLTPNELWYVRHHHPVPVVDPAEYRMEISMHASLKPAPSLEEQVSSSMFLFFSVWLYLPTYLSIHPCIHPSVHPSIHASIRPSFHPPPSLSNLNFPPRVGSARTLHARRQWRHRLSSKDVRARERTRRGRKGLSRRG